MEAPEDPAFYARICAKHRIGVDILDRDYHRTEITNWVKAKVLAKAKEGLVRLAEKYFLEPGRVYHMVRMMGTEAGDYLLFSHLDSLRERAIVQLMFQWHAEAYYKAHQRLKRRRDREFRALKEDLIQITERAGLSTTVRLKLLQDSLF